MHWFRFWTSVLVLLIAAGMVGPASAQSTINEARQQALGTEVTIDGTVTRAYGSYVRLQDESGPTGASAIVIRQTSGTNSADFQGDISDGTIQPGTTLEVTGTTSAFYGLIQINNDNLASYTVQGQGDPPAPQSVTLSELAQNGEDYESELLRIEGLRFAGASGSFENETTYTVENDAGTSFEFRVQASAETELGGTPVPGSVFAYEGVLGQFHGQQIDANEPNEGYQLIPVRTSDLKAARSFSFNRLFSIAEEGAGDVSVQVQAFNLGSSEVSVTAQIDEASTASGADVTGFQSPRTLTFSQSDSAPKTLTFTPAADSEQEGVERLEVVLSSDDGAISSPRRFTLWIADGPAAQAPIAAGDSSSALLSALRSAYSDPPTLGYDRARDSLYKSILNDQGTVETIYGGFQASADPAGDATAQLLDQDVNTEHLWPRSKGSEQEPALSNMYILAPAWAEANGYRCNYPFAEIDDADAQRWIRDKTVQSAAPSSERATYTESIGNSCGSPSDNGRLEPRHTKKGDVARAMFYFAMAYPNRADLSFLEQQRETLLEWHREDPVDATELRRSLIKASYQGNKVNPFILDSTLAPRAYGGGIPEPEAVSIQEARQQGGGTVTVEGVVTRVGADGPYIQDETGGLYVFESEGSFGQELGGSIQKGTRLEVTGTLTYYNGLLELTDVPEGGFEVTAQDEPLPDPATLTVGDIADNGEDYEAELVRVEGFTIQADGDQTFQAGGSAGNYTVDDGTGTVTLRIPSGSALEGEPIPERATFQGALGQFNGEGFDADEPDSGYQLLAIEAGDLAAVEGALPSETTIDVTRSFGDPSTGESYRLVALPGQIDLPLANTLDGENGLDWQAYWDNGSDQDFFVKFDGSDTFAFQPGRGFWLLNTSDWSVERTVSTVSVTNGEATIPLHDGWNIVSNPLPRDVAWSDVEAANDGALQALWGWDSGTFRQASTFTSATSGRAFYFLNDQGLDQLSIPVTAPNTSTARVAAAADRERAVELVAEGDGGTTARVQVAEHAAAADGKDPHDLIAPPSQFADLTLAVRAPFEDAAARQTRLARDVRAADDAAGQTYTLVLRADTTGPVTLRAASLPRSAQTHAVLLHPETGERHNLRTDGPMTLPASTEPTRVRLLVGTGAYVDDQARERVPETLTVEPPAPNPFRDQTTLRYALPEAQDVRIVVYDLLGRQVQTLVDGRQDAGPHQTTWTGQSGTRGQLASGTYLIRWSAGGEQHVEQVVLVR